MPVLGIVVADKCLNLFMSLERDKVMERLKKSLKQQGIEVFEWDCMNPPEIVPSVALNYAVVYKKGRDWCCIYIPENPRVLISKGRTVEESMKNFDLLWDNEMIRAPDVLECDRVYEMLKFDEVRTLLYEHIVNLGERDAAVLGAISNWGDTYDGNDAIYGLAPVVRGTQAPQFILEKNNLNQQASQDKELLVVNDKGELKKEDPISTILSEAQHLVSYCESHYIQSNEEYDIDVIEEIRGISERINSLKDKLTTS